MQLDPELRLPTYYISHGGGPWPYMNGPMRDAHAQLEAFLKAFPRDVGLMPKGILVISAHWEETKFSVMANPAPTMIYDYSGFPEETYSVRYRAPGSPELAEQVHALLQKRGFVVEMNHTRGYDHGTYVPFSVAFPDENVPIIQLSIHRDYNPEVHLAVGRALAPLREKEILIVGSGASYHNLRDMGSGAKNTSHAFDYWLTQSLCTVGSEERSRRLRHWTDAPSARAVHPREDHLVPLFVAVGAAESEPGYRVHHEDAYFGNIASSSYRFGNPYYNPDVALQ
ncbi:dioxygenase [bacterium]|nr:dioxygenase [bacterium]